MNGSKLLKAKVIMYSNDYGETWTVIKQIMLSDRISTEFLDDTIAGTRLKRIERYEHGRPGTDDPR